MTYIEGEHLKAEIWFSELSGGFEEGEASKFALVELWLDTCTEEIGLLCVAVFRI
jgi:hypothetical protein